MNYCCHCYALGAMMPDTQRSLLVNHMQLILVANTYHQNTMLILEGRVKQLQEKLDRTAQHLHGFW